MSLNSEGCLKKIPISLCYVWASPSCFIELYEIDEIGQDLLIIFQEYIWPIEVPIF